MEAAIDTSCSSEIVRREARGCEPEDLESIADGLLEAAGVFKQGSCVYRGRQLKRKIRNEMRRMPRVAVHDVPHEVMDYLIERRIDELVDAGSLTVREEIVFRLHASGMSCRDQAATLGIKHQAIAFRLRRALRKVRASYREGRYAGWYEVYLSEVNRPVYRARR